MCKCRCFVSIHVYQSGSIFHRNCLTSCRQASIISYYLYRERLSACCVNADEKYVTLMEHVNTVIFDKQHLMYCMCWSVYSNFHRIWQQISIQFKLIDRCKCQTFHIYPYGLWVAQRKYERNRPMLWENVDFLFSSHLCWSNVCMTHRDKIYIENHNIECDE